MMYLPVIDSSAIFQTVSNISSDHEIGSGDDDDDKEWINEQNEIIFFTFSFDDKDF